MKLNYKRTFLIGLAFLSISSFWQMYDNVIPLILKNTFGLGETITGLIMGCDNILALFLLPLFGSFSDKVETPIGKRMPFVVVGTAIAASLLIGLAIADLTHQLILFVVILFFLLIALGLYRSPAVALMPDLTPKKLRSQGNAIINLMGAVGGVIALLMIKFLVGGGQTPSYLPLFTTIAIFMVVCVAILFFTIKENKLRQEMPEEVEEEVEETVSETGELTKPVKRSLTFMLLSISLWFMGYNAVTTAFSRYATHVWGLENGGYANCLMVATVAAIISYLPIGYISSKIGRKKSISIGIVLLSSCFLAAAFYGNYHFTMNIFFCFIGFAWAMIGVNSLPMVVDICKGGDIGKYTGLYYTFSMSAQVITPILSGFFLEFVSYRMLFPYSFVCAALAFFTMQQVQHGDTKPLVKDNILENFDVED